MVLIALPGLQLKAMLNWFNYSTTRVATGGRKLSAPARRRSARKRPQGAQRLFLLETVREHGGEAAGRFLPLSRKYRSRAQ